MQQYGVEYQVCHTTTVERYECATRQLRFERRKWRATHQPYCHLYHIHCNGVDTYKIQIIHRVYSDFEKKNIYTVLCTNIQCMCVSCVQHEVWNVELADNGVMRIALASCVFGIRWVDVRLAVLGNPSTRWMNTVFFNFLHVLRNVQRQPRHLNRPWGLCIACQQQLRRRRVLRMCFVSGVRETSQPYAWSFLHNLRTILPACAFSCSKLCVKSSPIS